MKPQVLLLALCTVILVSACKQSEPSTCTDQLGNRLELIDAIADAKNSECGQYNVQPEGAFCNNYTGTWWIPIDAKQVGCNPACVVSVANGSSEINWRCTGLKG